MPCQAFFRTLQLRRRVGRGGRSGPERLWVRASLPAAVAVEISTAIKLGARGVIPRGPGNTAPGRGYALQLRACRYVGSSHLFRVIPAAREAVSLLFGEEVLNHSSVLVDP